MFVSKIIEYVLQRVAHDLKTLSENPSEKFLHKMNFASLYIKELQGIVQAEEHEFMQEKRAYAAKEWGFSHMSIANATHLTLDYYADAPLDAAAAPLHHSVTLVRKYPRV